MLTTSNESVSGTRSFAVFVESSIFLFFSQKSQRIGVWSGLRCFGGDLAFIWCVLGHNLSKTRVSDRALATRAPRRWLLGAAALGNPSQAQKSGQNAATSGQTSAAALFLGAAALWRVRARTDFPNCISLSFLVQITHVICRWKALSMNFNLVCNFLQ